MPNNSCARNSSSMSDTFASTARTCRRFAIGNGRRSEISLGFLQDQNAPMNDATAPVVFLFDVDNTLLDNDRVIEDLRRHLQGSMGPERERCYWAIFERLRSELGYADY